MWKCSWSTRAKSARSRRRSQHDHRTEADRTRTSPRSSCSYPLMDVVERAGVRLRRSGSHRLQGLCPFHAERTASFFVDIERQRFMCFGCKVRGDVIDFVRLREQLGTFSRSVRLVDRAPAPPAPTLGHHHSPARATGSALGPIDAGAAAGAERRRHPVPGRRSGATHGLASTSQGADFPIGWFAPAAWAMPTVIRLKPLRKHGGLRIAEELGLLRRPEPGEGGRMLRERFAGRDRDPGTSWRPTDLVPRTTPDRSPVRVKYLGLPGEKPVLGLRAGRGAAGGLPHRRGI